MIRHVVLCKFRSDASEEAVADFIRECDKLPSINREVKNWVSGRSAAPHFHSGDFDWALSCDLADWDAMDRYMWHEGHLRMAPWAAATVAYMQSFDFDLEYEAPADPAPVPPTPEPAPAPAGQVRVPELRGRRLEEAKGILASAGLEVAPEVETVMGSVWAPGRVVRSAPTGGTLVPEGSQVRLGATGDWWSRPDLPKG